MVIMYAKIKHSSFCTVNIGMHFSYEIYSFSRTITLFMVLCWFAQIQPQTLSVIKQSERFCVLVLCPLFGCMVMHVAACHL